MNVGSSSDSNSSNSCQVSSKYFAGKGELDESLSDFQEKKNFTSAKASQKKTSTTKPKPKKNLKRIRGQKDIRSVLNPNKNELVSYSYEFDKICQKSGIDVDSEQLQLAIALSKSLQQPQTSSEEEPSSSKSLTSQERSNKIRTTLQEYGFVVPDVKITAPKRRNVKKFKKNYKLLQTTEAEKQQIISDKFSQVLFETLDNTKVANIFASPTTNSSELYHKGTDIAYEVLKDNTILYVKDLFEKLPSTVGCLLKDWSKIPGRPASPTYEPVHVKFKKNICTEEELDLVLSGPLNHEQEVVKNNYMYLPSEETVYTHFIKIEDCEKKTEALKMDLDRIEVCENDEFDTIASSAKQNLSNEVMESENTNLLTVSQSARSCSPDIFDDEVSELIESPRKAVNITPQKQTKTVPCHNTMNLTECCLKICSQTANLNTIPTSQETNTTKRKSNDFMDITGCVVGSSQPIRENIIEENVDLTQDSDDEDAVIINEVIPQNIDLTQSSDSNGNDTIIQAMDDTIIFPTSKPETRDNAINDTPNNLLLEKYVYPGNSEHKVYSNGNEHHDMDIITEKRRVDSVQVGNKQNKKPDKRASKPETCDNAINDTPNNLSVERYVCPGNYEHKVYSNGKEHHDMNLDIITEKRKFDSVEDGNKQNKKQDKRAISPIEHVNNYDSFLKFRMRKRMSIIYNKPIEACEGYSEKSRDTNVSKSQTRSFEELVHPHSENNEDNTIEFDSNASNISITNDNNESRHNRINQTQKTESSQETNSIPCPKIPFDSKSLGKVGDVSIDYDELFDDMAKSHKSSTSQSKSVSSKTSHKIDVKNSNKPSNSDLVSSSSQHSEAFEISDKELDYSVHQSKLDFNPLPNYDFGGISVVDEIPDLPSFRPSTSNIGRHSFNRSMSDSFLPVVNVMSTENNNVTVPYRSASIPDKEPSKDVTAKTPTNEYIIKTDTVTPMKDYERMTTPERNNELDKYGLKPFKRKRAIQLLTHIYNQTHPIIESLDNLPSPLKKYKLNTEISPIKSLKKISGENKSPKKVSKTARKLDIGDENGLDLDEEIDIYDVTNEVPDIRDIECSEEDWVFQKREKTKLHSCRVPLHIALHNYVSTRRRLFEAMLRYEPVDIEKIHKGLVNNGFRYDPKDLLKFMDKKCITVKTADNNARNKKHY